MLAALIAAASPPCAADDTTADLVAGQLTFTVNMPNFTDALGVFFPAGVALDNSSTPPHLYVADQNNNRVLGWLDAESFVNGAAADLVIGEPDFFTVVPPVTGGRQLCPPPSAANLCFPRGVAVDSNGNLYVADTSNNRVLEYNTPFISGTIADRVFGQGGSFTANICNRHLIAADSLCGPVRVALDASGNLYVSDFGNNRVLEYNAPLTSGEVADLVFGQLGSFTTGACNRGVLGPGTLCAPTGVAIDAGGNVYIADTANSRVLRYVTPLITKSTNATVVLGQATFTAAACNHGATSPSASTLCQPQDVATDSGANLYVSDAGNSRVLKYVAPLTTAQAAAVVFGQSGSFTSSQCDLSVGSVTAATLCAATGLAVDSAGNLFMGDTGNSRVLIFQPPFPAKPVAVREAGQPDLTHGGANRIDARGISAASAVALDESVTPKRLYLADTGNNRVLAWANAAEAFNHLPADLVIGQSDAFSGICGSGHDALQSEWSCG